MEYVVDVDFDNEEKDPPERPCCCQNPQKIQRVRETLRFFTPVIRGGDFF